MPLIPRAKERAMTKFTYFDVSGALWVEFSEAEHSRTRVAGKSTDLH